MNSPLVRDLRFGRIDTWEKQLFPLQFSFVLLGDNFPFGEDWLVPEVPLRIQISGIFRSV